MSSPNRSDIDRCRQKRGRADEDGFRIKFPISDTENESAEAKAVDSRRHHRQPDADTESESNILCRAVRRLYPLEGPNQTTINALEAYCGYKDALAITPPRSEEGGSNEVDDDDGGGGGLP